MKKLKTFLVAALLVGMVSTFTPAISQTNPDTRATTEEHDDDDDTNYGWLGLIGLIGLAGLLKKDKHVHDGRESTTSTKFNS